MTPYIVIAIKLTLGSDFFVMLMMTLAAPGGDGGAGGGGDGRRNDDVHGGGDDSKVDGTLDKLLELFGARLICETKEAP